MYLRAFEPGHSPCAGACSLEWASDAAGVTSPAHVRPMPMTVEAGTIVEWMSYARDGAPYGGPVSMFVLDDQPAIGWRLDDGRYFVRFDACENWAVVDAASAASHTSFESYWTEIDPILAGSHHASSETGWTTFGASDWRSVTESPKTDPAPPVSPVDLPTPLMLLASALLVLSFSSHRSRHR